jgi:hypothetical protein
VQHCATCCTVASANHRSTGPDMHACRFKAAQHCHVAPGTMFCANVCNLSPQGNMAPHWATAALGLRCCSSNAAVQCAHRLPIGPPACGSAAQCGHGLPTGHLHAVVVEREPLEPAEHGIGFRDRVAKQPNRVRLGANHCRARRAPPGPCRPAARQPSQASARTDALPHRASKAKTR